MKQEKIKALLEEASEIAKNFTEEERYQDRSLGDRLSEIGEELEKSAFQKEDSDDPNEDRDVGINAVLHWLFWGTISNRPDYLPKLFPAFAIMCGDSDTEIVSEIDWTLVSSENT